MIKECMECEALFEVVENFQPCPCCGETENLERFKYNKFSDGLDDIKDLEEELSKYPENSYEREQVNEEIEQLVNVLTRLDKWGLL